MNLVRFGGLVAAVMLLLPLGLGCAPAEAGAGHAPAAVTAGPSAVVDVAPGDTVVVSLERATDPLAVFQSDGLVLPAQPTLVSARLQVSHGEATALLQLGPRGGPWRTIAEAGSPPIIPPILVFPDDGEMVRVAASSVHGAQVVGSPDGPRATWVTALPLQAVQADQ